MENLNSYQFTTLSDISNLSFLFNLVCTPCTLNFKPENIKTTYQLIQQDIKTNWENEFLSAKNTGNMSKYTDDEYFSLWQLPVEKWSSITENYIILWSENQGVWTAGYLLKDLQAENPNPPIYISANDDLITYVKCVDNIELFLKIMFEEAKNEM